MDEVDDTGGSMALVIGAYWSGVASVEDVVSTARLVVDGESPETLHALAALNPNTTDALLPGLLGAVLEDFGLFLTRNLESVLEVFSLAYMAPQFHRHGELDRQAFVSWVAATFDHPVADGFAQCLAELDAVYAARFVQSWGHSDEVEAMVDSAVDYYVQELAPAVAWNLELVSDSSATFRPPLDDETLSSPGLGAWSPALADTIGGVIQAILRGT